MLVDRVFDGALPHPALELALKDQVIQAVGGLDTAVGPERLAGLRVEGHQTMTPAMPDPNTTQGRVKVVIPARGLRACR
jgi:hypothetical protein